MRRRRFLTGIGSAAAAVLAGCLGGSGGSNSNSNGGGSGNASSGDGSGGSAPAPAATGSYRSFQYDAGNTGRTDASGPTANTKRWTFREAVSGPAYSVGTPAAADGTVYVAEGGKPGEDAGRKDIRTTVYALDAVEGSVEWSYEGPNANSVGGTALTESGDTLFQLISGRLVGLATDSGDRTFKLDADLDAGPVVAGDTAYVLGKAYSGPPTLYAVGPDGTTRWKRDVELGGEGLYPSPAVGGDTVYVGGGKLLALSTEDGSERWRTDLEGNLGAAPTVDGDALYVHTGETTVRRLSAADGSQQWSASVERSGRGYGSALSSPAVADDTVVVTTQGQTIGLSAADGAVEWTARGGGDSPVVAGEEVYVSDLGRLSVFGLDGERKWTHGIRAESSSGVKTAVVLEGVAYVPLNGLHAVV